MARRIMSLPRLAREETIGAMSADRHVLDVNESFYRALSERDLPAMDGIWLHDELATCVHPGWQRLEGWGPIRASWEAIFRNTPPWQVACDEIRISVGGHHAWVCCVEVIRPLESGDEPARMEATNIFQLSPQGWRLIHHHASAAPPQRARESFTSVQ